MRKTPQIPRDVFFGDAAPAAAPQPEPEPVPVPVPVAPPPPAPVVAVAPAPPSPPEEEGKVQVTIYLSPQSAKRLEALRFHLLNEHNVKVSKSAITEYAIRQVGDDLRQLAAAFAVGER